MYTLFYNFSAIILLEDQREQGEVYPNNNLGNEVIQHQHSGAEFCDKDLTHSVMKAETKPMLANNLSQSTETLLDQNHSVNDTHLPCPVPLTQQSPKSNLKTEVEDLTQMIQSRASKLAPMYDSQQLSSNDLHVQPVLENDQFIEHQSTNPPSTVKHPEENQEMKIMDPGKYCTLLFNVMYVYVLYYCPLHEI